MKKLVLLLSFVFALGLFSLSAQDAQKKVVKKTPAKTEKVVKAKTTTKPSKKSTKTVKKTTKKGVTPAPPK